MRGQKGGTAREVPVPSQHTPAQAQPRSAAAICIFPHPRPSNRSRHLPSPPDSLSNTPSARPAARDRKNNNPGKTLGHTDSSQIIVLIVLIVLCSIRSESYLQNKRHC